MSLKFVTLVARRSKGLTAKAGNVLRVLAERADLQGRCFPSQATIAEDANVSPRTVRSALKELEECGWITRQHRQRRDGSRSSDLITISDEEAIARHVEAMLRLPLMAVVPADQAVDRDGGNTQSNRRGLPLGQPARFASREPVTSTDSLTCHLRAGARDLPGTVQPPGKEGLGEKETGHVVSFPITVTDRDHRSPRLARTA